MGRDATISADTGSVFRDRRDLLQDWMRGRITYVTILHYLEDKTEISYKVLEDELQYSSENMTYIDPSAIEQVQVLRANGVKVVIATDNMDTFQRWTVPALQLDVLFDDILTSNTQQALKADFNSDGTSAFFASYVSRSIAEPSEMVLLDDSLDTKIIKGVGMDFLRVTEAMPLGYHLANILAQ